MDLAHLLLQSGASVLIIQDRGGPISYTATVRELVPGVDHGTPESFRTSPFPRLRHLLVLGDDRPAAARRWADVFASADGVGEEALAARCAAVTPEATALIMYTSGTTGAPNGNHPHELGRPFGRDLQSGGVNTAPLWGDEGSSRPRLPQPPPA